MRPEAKKYIFPRRKLVKLFEKCRNQRQHIGLINQRTWKNKPFRFCYNGANLCPRS